MLILVGVVVTVALNGELFKKSKYATQRTEIELIKEQALALRADKMTENNGKVIDNWDITIDDLNLPENIKQKYKDKIMVNNIGELEYDPSVIKGEERQLYDELGIICIADYFRYEGSRVRGLTSLGSEKIKNGKNILQIPSENRNGQTTTSIGAVAFNGLNIKELIIPDTLTRIDEWCFKGSGNFKVRIPASVTNISYYVFWSPTVVYVPFTRQEGRPSGWNKDWSVGATVIYAGEE